MFLLYNQLLHRTLHALEVSDTTPAILASRLPNGLRNPFNVRSRHRETLKPENPEIWKL